MADGKASLIVEAVDKATSVLGGIGGALGKVAGMAGGLVTAGLGAATAAVGGIGAAALASAQEMDGAFDAIAVQTGATGAELEGLQEDFKIAFANVPADADTVAGALGKVSQKLGLTGKPLQDVTQQLVRMSDMMGGDATTAAAGFTEVMQKWDVPVGDASGTLDKLFVAAQQSGLGVETLMQKITTFAAPMQQLGFSLDETAGMMAKWEKSGLNADKMMSALSTAASKFASTPEEQAKAISEAQGDLDKYSASLKGLSGDLAVAEQKQREFKDTAKASEKMELANKISELRDKIATTKDAISGTTQSLDILRTQTASDIPTAMASAVTAIQGAKTETEALGLAADLFGAKAAPDLAKAIRSGAFSADDLVRAMQGAEGAINTTAQATADFPEKFEMLKNKVTVALEPLGGLIMTGIGTALDAVGPHIGTLTGWLTDTLAPAVSDVVGDISDGFGEAGVAGAIASGATRIGEMLGMTAEDATAMGDTLYTVLNGIITTAGDVVTWVQANWPAIQKVIGDVFAAVSGFVTQYIVPFAQSVIEGAGAAVKWIETNWPAIQTTITTAFEQAKAIVEPILTAIGTVISTIFGAASGTVEEHGTSILTNLTTAWNSIQATIGPVITAIGTIISTVFGAVQTFLAEHGTEIQTFVGTAWQTISGIIAGVVGVIQGTIVPIFTGIATFLSTHGEEIKGVLEGAWGLISSAVEGALGFISGIVTAVMAALNGDWTAAWAAIEGAVTAVWEGIKGVISGALLVVTSTLTMAWDAIKGDLERKWATIKAAVETVWTSITTSVSTAITSVKTTLSTAWTSIKTEVEGAWLSVRTSIEGAVQGALDFIAGLPATMLQFGKDLIQGFIDGIGRMAGSIKEAILNLLPPALRDLATQLGIKSPSTVMMWYGKQLMAGLAKGVESYASLPRRELSGVLADVASMGSRGGSSANTSVAGGAYGAGVGMTATPRDEMYVVSITLDGEEIARKLLSRVTGLVHDDMGRYAPA